MTETEMVARTGALVMIGILIIVGVQLGELHVPKLFALLFG
jgi:hypothetical protein